MVNRFAVNNFRKGVPHASFSCINEYPNRSARGLRSNRPRSTLLAGEAPIAEYFMMSISMKGSNQNDFPFGNDVSNFLKQISTLLVVKQESPIFGFACAFGGEDELFGTMLDNLHVLQSQKGKGIERKLVRDIASWCDRDYSAKGHFAQKHFYERLGGVVVGEANRSAPDGTTVKEICYAWKNIIELIVATQ
jgi:GNAT superfamily N-acetyltransferase